MQPYNILRPRLYPSFIVLILSLIMSTRCVFSLYRQSSLKLKGKLSSCGLLRTQKGLRNFSTTSGLGIDNFVQQQHEFISDIAKFSVPKRLPVLLEILKSRGEELVSPRERTGINPFLIPLSKNLTDNSLTCYLRWPTQKVDMDLQLVKTNEVGVTLLALSTDKYCHRQLIEADFFAHNSAQHFSEIVNRDSKLYQLGDYLPFLKSGKFPAQTERDLRLVLDRYLLSKVGPFYDCYERLADNFYDQKNEVSALVTCERSVAVFYSWGHPLTFHSMMLTRFGRDKEARDTARSAMGSPKWTLAHSKKELVDICKLSGYSDVKVVGDMHAFRGTDPRTKEVEEGLNPIQVRLDQAAHLMDAVALGVVDGGWETVRPELASRYKEAGYPEIAAFIECKN